MVIVVVRSLSRVRLFTTPWTAARQALFSFTISWSSLKLMSVESMMPSNHLILRRPLFLLPSIFPSIKALSNESVLCLRWPKYWRFSISPSNEYSGNTAASAAMSVTRGCVDCQAARIKSGHDQWGKDPEAGKDWRQEEKEAIEDEMVGWHHRLKGHEFE